MPTIMLSPHFTLQEFTYSQTAAREGIPNQPDEAAMENLHRTADVMEKVRSICGDFPVTITSGYRGPQLNAAIGGSSTSAHMFGLAADFIIPGAGDPHAVCKLIEPHMAELGIDQLIWEYEDWVHLGLSSGPPRCQALTINNYGTSTGIA
jgi:zinc D-Ala-D-Ala carboxypeptidase